MSSGSINNPIKLSGSINSTVSLSTSIQEKNTINGQVGNGIFIPAETDPTVPNHVKEITVEDIDRWNEEVDLSVFYTKEEIENKGYLTDIPDEYVTETELDNKGYLTEHQDITHLATKEELNTKADLEHIHEEYLTEHQNINHLATKEELTNSLNNKSDVSHTHDQYLTSVPSEYITETELNSKGYLTEHQNINHLATKEDVYNGLNSKSDVDHTHSEYITDDELNSKGYLTNIPSEYITETELNSKGYLTEHQDISHLATKEELNNIDVDLTDYYTKTEIDNKGYLTHDDVSDLDINVISDETIDEIVNFQITNANEVSY